MSYKNIYGAQKIVEMCYFLKNRMTLDLSDGLQEAYKSSIPVEDLDNLKKDLQSNRDLFLDLFSSFDKAQESYFYNFLETYGDQMVNSQAQLVTKDLFKNGCARITGLLSQEQLKQARYFIEVLDEACVNNATNESGYLLPRWDDSGNPLPCGAQFKMDDKYDGQIRVQSKSWGAHPKGIDELVNLDAGASTLKEVFALYNNLRALGKFRSNTEWINISETNHNGWHRDMCTPQLKAMILLEDTDEASAPLLFAKKSHRAITEFDKQHFYDMFCYPPRVKYGLKATWPENKNQWPEYAIKEDKRHVGYISSDYAPNDLSLEERKQDKVEISGQEYDLFVGTGKAGDVIFFDSCGLHSGSKALKTRRTNTTVSTISSHAPKHCLFNIMQSLY